LINLEDISKQLKIICENKVNEIAVKNILQAKLSTVFSFKNISFTSYANMQNAKPICYYAFNFVSSGANKGMILDEINSSLLKFYEEELDKFNNERYEKLKKQLDSENKYNPIEKNKELTEKQIELKSKIRTFKPLSFSNSSGSQAKIYDHLFIIHENKKGAFCCENTEFANYFYEAFINKNMTNKEYINMFFNLWDGKFDATDTVQTNRKNLNNIPFSAVLMSDPKLLIDDVTLSRHFLNYLSTGMARRSFIYFNINDRYFDNYIEVQPEEKTEAYNKLKIYSKNIKKIFDNIIDNTEYKFTEEANQRVMQHNRWVIQKIKEFYRLNDYLDDKTTILKLNIEHSTWKIIKLAVLYSILRNDEKKLVKVEDFNKAFEFFLETHEYLKDMLFVNVVSECDKLFNYLLRNLNKWQSRGDLRKQQFVKPDSYFTTWLEKEALPIIQDMAVKKGLGYVEQTTGKNKNKKELVIFDPLEYEYKMITEFEGKLCKIPVINEIDSLD